MSGTPTLPASVADADPAAEEVVRLDPHIQAVIGKALRAHYEDILRMPIPDSMLVLLAELEAKERQTK